MKPPSEQPRPELPSARGPRDRHCCAWPRGRVGLVGTGSKVSSSIPVTSKGRFLSAVTTGPSFLRKRGLLRLSATFCFSRDRNFRLGSEAAREGKCHHWPADPPGPGRLVAVLSHARWAHTCGVTRSAVPGLSRGWALARGQECPLAKMNERQPKPLPTSFGYRATNAPVGSSQTVGSVRYTGRREEEAGGLSGLCPGDTVTPPSPAHLSRVLTQKHVARLSTHVLREGPTRGCRWWPCREKGRPSQLPHPSTGECPCRSDHLTTGHRPLATVWLLTALSMVTEPFANL